MNDSKDVWTVGDVLNAMSGPGGRSSALPDHMLRVMQEVQDWLASAISEDGQADLLDIATGSVDRGCSGDLEYLFGQLEWATQYADVIPAPHDCSASPKEDAIILSVGSIVLDEGLRMMVDHAALFAAGACRRVWLVSDTWIIGDILSYMPHIRALLARGIELRFLLVTPWGFSEIPWSLQG